MQQGHRGAAHGQQAKQAAKQRAGVRTRTCIYTCCTYTHTGGIAKQGCSGGSVLQLLLLASVMLQLLPS